MKSLRLFFVIGSFAFLYWYMPEAVKDNRVTLVEIGIIAINVICFISNLLQLLFGKKAVAK